MVTYLHDNELFILHRYYLYLLPERHPPNRVERMHYSLGGAGLAHTSVGRVGRYMDLVGSVLVSVAVDRSAPWPASSNLRRLSPQALTLHGGAGLFALRRRRPFSRECRRGLRHFWSHRSCLRPNPPKKALYHTHSVGLTYDKYRLLPSSRTWQFRTDTSTCCTHSLILYIFSVYSIDFSHLLSLLPCLLSGP